MSASQDFKALAEQLRAYGAADLAAGVGGLQLLPENADHLVRLEAAAVLVASVESTSKGGRLSAKRWRELFNKPPMSPSQFSSNEDRYDDVFVDEVSFFGGSYGILPGLMDDAASVVQRLVEAIFLPRTPMSSLAFMERVARMTLIGLRLSSEIVWRAGLKRGQGGAHTDDVLIFPSGQFQSLKAAVTFSREDMEAFFEETDTRESDLAPFVRAQAAQQEYLEDIDSSPVLRSPRLRIGDGYVVVLPSGLLAALCHAIVSLATKMDLGSELSARYRAAVARSVREALRKLGTREVRFSETPTNTLPAWTGWFSFDRDKVIYVVVLSDTLDGYDPGRMYGEWPTGNLGEALASHLAEIEQTAFTVPKAPNEVLFLIVTGGIGRYSFLGLPSETGPWASKILALNPADLETIAVLERGKQLALWQYTNASERYGAHTRVVKTSELDEFALYRTSGYGYYISDDPYPRVDVITRACRRSAAGSTSAGGPPRRPTSGKQRDRRSCSVRGDPGSSYLCASRAGKRPDAPHRRAATACMGLGHEISSR